MEHGDLEMLLGGLTAELFDSTVSVGQLKSRPGRLCPMRWKIMRRIIMRRGEQN